MRIVKCYECRKSYNYDEDGFCPNCGAFNQPPRPSRIGPDGSVIWIEGINSRNHEGSFVHQEFHSENRERKGTSLEQEPVKRNAGRSASPKSVIRQPLPRRDGTPSMTFAGGSAKKKKGGKSVLVWIVIILIFLLELLGRM